MPPAKKNFVSSIGPTMIAGFLDFSLAFQKFLDNFLILWSEIHIRI